MLIKINENYDSMTVQEFMDIIENTYHKYFPNSKCLIKFGNLLGTPYILIRCYLANSASELSGGYWENDMMHISFNVNLPKNITSTDDSLPTTITIEVVNGPTFATKPYKPEDKYCAYGSVKIPFRKTSGTPSKVVTSFDRFSSKLYDTISREYADGHLDAQHEKVAKTKL